MTTLLGPPHRRFDHTRYGLVTDGLHVTTAAIITHGCEPGADEFGADQLTFPL